jgi:Tol biopolymer transport system component
MPLEPGSRLGPYEIVDALGAGGMGEVYRARDTRLDREVAVKVLPGHLSDQPTARQRFDREARAVSDLNHPHICTLHDIGHEAGVDFLVMELLEGRTLADRIAEGQLPLDEALGYAVQIADALDAAHQKNVIHRDLKPGNVMLTKTGAKLLDFGLAKSAALAGTGGDNLTVSPTMTTPLTAEGTIVGTFQYMAPEQLEGKEADARSDLFAFGAVLYEMLTGRKAFAGESQATLIAAIIKEEPRPVSASTSVAPRSLDRLVRRCLAKQPDERWQTARDVALELRWIREHGAADEAEASVPAPSRGTLPWLPWAVTVAAIAVAVFFALRGPGGGPSRSVRLTIPIAATTEFGDNLASPPAVSPDGSIVAFGVIDDSGSRSLQVRSIDDFEARPLPNTRGAGFAFWSPDNRHVGFFGEGKIKRVEVATGRVQTLADAGVARGGSWSGDGKIIFAPTSNSGIYMVDSSGGAAEQLTTPDPEIPDCSHRWPVFLPDGEHFLFVLWTNDPAARQEHGGVYVASITDAEPPRLLLPDPSAVAYAPPGYLLVVRGENLIAVPFDASTLEVTGKAIVLAEGAQYNPGNGHAMFSVSAEGTLVYAAGVTSIVPSDLARYDREGSRRQTIGDPSPYVDLRLSPDGTRAAAMIYGAASSTGEIWVVDLERSVRTRLAAGAWYHDYPVWSPEGDCVLYGSQEEGSQEVYSRRADGSGEEQLIYETGQDTELFDLSPDGKYLAVFEVGSGRPRQDIWIYSIEEQKVEPFSPDSKWVAYVSTESGRSEVFIQGLARGSDAGGRWQVSTAGGLRPHWRQDGRELIYVDLERRVMAVPAELTDRGWVLGTPVELFRIADPIAAMDVSADHQSFLIATRDDAVGEPLRVVIGWRPTSE